MTSLSSFPCKNKSNMVPFACQKSTPSPRIYLCISNTCYLHYLCLLGACTRELRTLQICRYDNKQLNYHRLSGLFPLLCLPHGVFAGRKFGREKVWNAFTGVLGNPLSRQGRAHDCSGVRLRSAYQNSYIFLISKTASPRIYSGFLALLQPCVPLVEQGNDLVNGRTYFMDYEPSTPPPSPTKVTPISRLEPNGACPCTSCALLLVDQKIEADQARSSPASHSKVPSSYPPTILSHSVSRMKLEYSDDQMHNMALDRQVSSASDDEEMAVPTTKSSSSRSSGSKPLPDDLPNDKVDAHFIANGVCSRIAKTLQSTAQPSSPPPTTFSLFSLRSSRETFGDAPSRYCSSSHRNDVLGPRPTVASRHSASPSPVASSTILDVTASSLEYKQAKTKSWPGPSSKLPGPDIVSMPKTTNSKARKREFNCAQFQERKARHGDGMSSCTVCLSKSETCSFNRCSVRLQPLEEYTRGEEATDHKQAATMEEDHSHFSDFSTDDEDNERPPHIRLVNSLGRLSRRSKTRLSWGNIFSKP
ncbi:hypothetical protein BDR22DRAFT_68400 [Usnea florida]